MFRWNVLQVMARNHKWPKFSFSKIRKDLFGVQGGGKDLENRVKWVELWSVCSSEKVGDIVIWMIEYILPDLPSATGTQFEVSPEGARSARV